MEEKKELWMEVSEILLRFTLTLIWTKKQRRWEFHVSTVTGVHITPCSILLHYCSPFYSGQIPTVAWQAVGLVFHYEASTSGAGETENCTLSKVRPWRETGKCFSTMTIRTGSRAFRAPTAAPSLLDSTSWFPRTQSANGLVWIRNGSRQIGF